MPKKEIIEAQQKHKDAVIKKWIPEKTGRNLKKFFAGVGASLSSMFACVEVLFYGAPVISTVAFGVYGLGIAQAVGSFTNKAGQGVESSEIAVVIVLKRMDSEMSDIFNLYATSENAEEKKLLKVEMEGIYKDTKALEGFYDITQGGNKGYGMQNLVFEMVAANTNKNVVTPAVTFNDVANGTVKYPQKNLRDTPSFKI